ncbi:MAG TPA: FtsX-like permease family protein [Prolixibacteraceae bacterium]|nr:FtsX-like permease family protein [Prolixibacteraceae bacterium]
MNSYLKLAIRNLLRNKEYFFINVFGLAVGMACAIMVLVYIWEQSNYDDFHPSSDRLYRVYIESKLGGLESNVAYSSPMFASGLKPYVPEIEQSCRIFKYDRDIPVIAPVSTILDSRTLLYVDSTFFDIFGFKLIEGDPKTCLSKPRSIVLTRSIANQLFPDGAVVGKTLTIEDEKKPAINGDVVAIPGENDKKWIVTGIVEDCPINSHINYQSLVSISSVVFTYIQWTNNNLYTYFRFKEGTDMQKPADSSYLDLTAIEDKLNNGFYKEAGDFIEKSLGTTEEMKDKDEYFVLRLQKVSDIHLFSHLKYETSQNVNIQTLLIIAGISILIILIACINYANLSTARLAGRVREIGIRKILGSQRRELSRQLLAESITISFISLFFALVIVELIYPNTSMVQQNPDLNIQMLLFKLSPVIFSVTLFTGIIAGIYPAFYIIRFSPATILRQQKQFSAGGKGLRGVLVILQFVFSLVIIYSTSTIYRQLRFVQQNEVGFQKERIFVIQNLFGLEDKGQKFINKLVELKNVEGITYSNAVPGKLMDMVSFQVGMESFQDEKDLANVLLMYVMEADSMFFSTYGMTLNDGSFDRKKYSHKDTIDVIVNEEAVKYLNLAKPIGSSIIRQNADTTKSILIIKGVVDNFNFESLHTKVQPLIIFPVNPEKVKFASVRLAQPVNRREIGRVQKLWETVYPKSQFSQFTMNESLGEFYQEEESTGQIAVVFSFFAIFIACMGLYSLLALTTIYRTKEIGIRKVLGAGTKELVLLLSKEIFRLITIAGIIALPISFLLSYYWLNRFAYHIALSFTNYFLVFIAVFIVAVFTIYRQLWHTINSDPGESLRFE